jgi:hypothetical protein
MTQLFLWQFYKGEIDMYKMIRSTFTLILGIVAVGLFQPVNADWTVDTEEYDVYEGGVSRGELQDIVITLKSNPMSNPEMACLAVTFARSLSNTELNPTNANVTLFVTLDGVTLADASVTRSRRFKCDFPLPDGQIIEISLKENLEAFIGGNDNNMVVCPLCWISRYGEELPDYGVLPGAEGVDPKAIGKMMLDADKILDF